MGNNSDGKTYKGEFQNGLAHGHGVEIDTNGKVIYEGQFVEGQTAIAAERAAAASAAKKRSDLLQEQHLQQSTMSMVSLPLSEKSSILSSSSSSFITLQPSSRRNIWKVKR